MKAKERVLIVTYYWPPAGGPGVQRWLKFATYLADFGIDPIVYIPENPTYPIIDEDLVKEVPKHIKVISQPISEPAKWAKKIFKKKTKELQSGIIAKEKSSLEKLLLYVRANFYIPDARVTWVQPSVDYLSAYCQKHQIKKIITTGPPHSMHLIGMQLQESIGVKWLADFRDPWTDIHYFADLPLSKRALAKHKALELEVLQKADKISVTSQPTKTLLAKLTDKPIEVITNGYDEALLPSKVELSKKFSIAHLGSLLTDRNPIKLWKVLANLLEEIPSLKSDVELHFAGVVSPEVKLSLEEYNLSELVIDYGYLSHEKAIELQHKHQLLLLLEMDKEETKVILPGKLFEYLAARRPILALGPKDGAVEQIIEETQAGVYIELSDEQAIYEQLKNFYTKYKEEGSLAVDSKGIEQYSRKAVSEAMSELIKSL